MVGMVPILIGLTFSEQRSVGAEVSWGMGLRVFYSVISGLSRRCREGALLVNVEWGLARLIENSGRKG